MNSRFKSQNLLQYFFNRLIVYLLNFYIIKSEYNFYQTTRNLLGIHILLLNL